MSTAKVVSTKATSLMEEMKESKRRDSSNELKIQIEDLEKVLQFSEAQTNHEETQYIKLGAQDHHDTEEKTQERLGSREIATKAQTPAIVWTKQRVFT